VLIVGLEVKSTTIPGPRWKAPLIDDGPILKVAYEFLAVGPHGAIYGFQL
jgi:hypothetical protein